MNLKVIRVAKVGGKEYGRIECKVGRRKMGFKEFESLCLRDYGVGHVSNSAQHPHVFLPTCYTHISSILAQNWACKNSLESSFNVECAHGMR